MTECLPTTTDVLIIGGGPAGAAAAAVLLGQGVGVCIIEKQVFPRFVIGESLLPRCMDLLAEADLLDAVSARGYLRKDGAVFLRGDERTAFLFGQQHGDGWTYTYQVPRHDFDATLLNTVEARGAAVFYEHEVVDVALGAAPLVTVRSPDGERHDIAARFIIDASGYGRVLPRLLDLDRPSHLPARHSLFTWIESDQREAGAAGGRTWVSVHPDGAWIWAIPFANGQTSVGVVAEPSFFERYPADPATRLRLILEGEPNIAARVQGADFAFEPRLIAGYSIGVKQLCGPNYCLVGNTMEFLDPVFSSGVALALESAIRAARLVARELAGEPVAWASEYEAYLGGGVAAFSAYVDAWYDGTLPTLLFAPAIPPQIQRQITSVLAGYVWDGDNPFVSDGKRRLRVLAKAVSEGATPPSMA